MPYRIFIAPILLSIALAAIIQVKFISGIDAFIQSNQEFSAEINAGIGQASPSDGRLIQLTNLNKINEAQTSALKTYKVGSYIAVFFIFVSGMFGAYVGYSSKANAE